MSSDCRGKTTRARRLRTPGHDSFYVACIVGATGKMVNDGYLCGGKFVRVRPAIFLEIKTNCLISEGIIMYKHTTAFVDFCRKELSFQLGLDYGYQSLSACILDCVYEKFLILD